LNLQTTMRPILLLVSILLLWKRTQSEKYNLWFHIGSLNAQLYSQNRSTLARVQIRTSSQTFQSYSLPSSMGTYVGAYPSRKLVSTRMRGRHQNLYIQYEARSSSAVLGSCTTGRYPRRYCGEQEIERALLPGIEKINLQARRLFQRHHLPTARCMFAIYRAYDVILIFPT
jgi:hypothetical protein